MKVFLSESDLAKVRALHESFGTNNAFDGSMAMKVILNACINTNLRSTERFLTKISGGIRKERIQLLTEKTVGSSVVQDENSEFKKGIKYSEANKTYMFSHEDRSRFFDTYGEYYG